MVDKIEIENCWIECYVEFEGEWFWVTDCVDVAVLANDWLRIDCSMSLTLVPEGNLTLDLEDYL